ncbi:alpha-amylase [Methanolobus halotolerans]|uniref:Alpha-amlyase n=1 Tax=Methanolobus halotolerans TaxID=2052935 RepID=A0A4E0QU19_9EURY|nr:alpha-amylase [Methanolobus halotolerans]TGC11535.1 alpha-amlyase [Methanolobus halotolerans]
MKTVCVCFEVHLPLPVRWYWPWEGYASPEIKKYFDMEKAFQNFTRLEKDMTDINRALADSMDNGGKYAFDISGVFLEQCKWTPGILRSFKELVSMGAGLIASPYYHSACPLFDDLKEFETQVHMHVETLEDLFGMKPVSFANPELLLEQKVMGSIRAMGFECFIAEGSQNLINGSEPVCVYENEVPTLLRHINLSEDIERMFSDRTWPGFPLIPEKFAAWVAGVQGDVITLYIKYDALQNHLRKNTEILQFLRDLPASLAKQDIEMLLPEEAAGRYSTEKLPSLHSKKTARYGMHNLLGNHAQHLYMYELQTIGDELAICGPDEKSEKLRNIYRHLQQTDIFLEMNAEGRRMGYERAVNNFSILSDLKRSLVEGCK